ncbi:MAG: CPBP family intramembrane glutamic endopeptidase [Promethearchaeota archaeon]
MRKRDIIRMPLLLMIFIPLLIVRDLRDLWIGPLLTNIKEYGLKFLGSSYIIILFLVILLFIASNLIILPKVLGSSINRFKNHIIIRSIREKDFFVLYFIFPLMMVFEELLFRGYIYVFFYKIIGLNVNLSILVISTIFSLYHIHIWFEFKDKAILFSFLINSFILGMICGYILIGLGLLCSILVHLSGIYPIFYKIYQSLYKK